MEDRTTLDPSSRADSALVAEALADDVAIVRRVLAHIDAGTTDLGDAWREPVEHYVDPQRFADEVAALRSTPSIFGPSALVPEVGDHVARTVFGVPLFAIRGRDGRARVFRNACRHRGATLVAGSGCAPSLVCGYHGWTYRLDGTLARVPHADGFPDLDTSERGLVEVASVEVAGLIVVGAVDPDRPSTEESMAEFTAGPFWQGPIRAELAITATAAVSQPVNWKVLVEQFIEGYHIRSTHRETFFPVQYDNLNVVEMVGANCRVTYPYRNIERLRDRPESEWSVGRRLTYVYHIFPNTMVATFPDRVLVVLIEPDEVARSTLTTFTLQSPDAAPTGETADDEPSLIGQGALEDTEMSLAVQAGFAAGANDAVEFGRQESALGHFHAHLDLVRGRLSE